MKIKNQILAIAVCLTAVFTTSAYAGGDASNSFYDRKSEGWFWYEPEPEPELEQEEKLPEPVATAPQEAESKEETKEVVVNVAWLRDNLPKLRDAAIDDPTYDNVRRYFYAQRVMMDKASKFASVSQEVSKFEVPLDETLRRPENQTALYDSKLFAKQHRSGLLKELSEQVGLFFFYSSNCSYCMKQAPLLKRFSKETGLEVLAVSLDGRPLPNDEFPDYVTDPGTLREKLRVMVTPTIYLVKKDGSEFHNIAAGLTAPDELMRRAIMLANRQGWITEEQYNSTKEVKEILLADSTKEELKVDPDKVYSDPNYLANKLREKFQSQYKPSTAPQNGEGVTP